LNNFVVFKDSKVFKKDKIWHLGEVLNKYRTSGLKVFAVGEILIKASNDKIIQKGIVIQATDKAEAIEIYEILKGLHDG
jgi:hypothetical protein